MGFSDAIHNNNYNPLILLPTHCLAICVIECLNLNNYYSGHLLWYIRYALFQNDFLSIWVLLFLSAFMETNWIKWHHRTTKQQMIMMSWYHCHLHTETDPGQRISGSSIRFCITDGATVSLTRYTRSLHHCDVSGHHAGQDFPLESIVEHKLTTRVDKQNPN